MNGQKVDILVADVIDGLKEIERWLAVVRMGLANLGIEKVVMQVDEPLTAGDANLLQGRRVVAKKGC